MNPSKTLARRAAALCPALASPLALALSACDAPTAPPAPDPPLEAIALPPTLPDPGDFVELVDNPWFPLIPGSEARYEAETDDGLETTVLRVLTDAEAVKVIEGIPVTIVHDRVFLDGEPVENTFDWYAQDLDGNVWYLGEDSCEYEDGVCVPEGEWEAGVDGALAGIIMWADPAAHVGEKYRQEYYEGEAEDVGQVLRPSVGVEVPYGNFEGCLETMDWNPLEPGHREHKFYCRGEGLVLEVSPRDGHLRNERVPLP